MSKKTKIVFVAIIIFLLACIYMKMSEKKPTQPEETTSPTDNQPTDNTQPSDNTQPTDNTPPAVNTPPSVNTPPAVNTPPSVNTPPAVNTPPSINTPPAENQYTPVQSTLTNVVSGDKIYGYLEGYDQKINNLNKDYRIPFITLPNNNFKVFSGLKEFIRNDIGNTTMYNDLDRNINSQAGTLGFRTEAERIALVLAKKLNVKSSNIGYNITNDQYCYSINNYKYNGESLGATFDPAAKNTFILFDVGYIDNNNFQKIPIDITFKEGGTQSVPVNIKSGKYFVKFIPVTKPSQYYVIIIKDITSGTEITLDTEPMETIINTSGLSSISVGSAIGKIQGSLNFYNIL